MLEDHARASGPSVGTRLPINVSRRGFMTGVGAGAFVLGLGLHSAPARADATAGGIAMSKGGEMTPSLFIALDESGTVTLTCHRSEMGQQTWTAMAQLLADELEADWDRIAIEQAVGDAKYGDQNTDGSRSVRWNFHRLRVAGAAMRTMLERAAAETWDVDPSDCRAEGHEVIGPDGRRLAYGELAEAAAAQAVPSEDAIALKPRERWRYIGKAVPSLTVPLIVEGRGTFGIDVKLPDMLVAVVARPPQVFGSVRAVDDAATLATPGVVQTVQLPKPEGAAGFQALGGVAVVARDTWSAISGRNALKIDWDEGPNAGYDSAAFAEAMRITARSPGEVRRTRGDVAAALGSAEKRIEADYYVPHLSQSPMEPPSATARWQDGKVECWGCVQAPQATRAAVAQACGISEDDVTVNVTWLGGGFGRKSKPDFVIEAALVARAVGRPVKVTWTREDEVRHGYYHSVSAQHLEGGLDAEGRCTAFLHRTVFPTISSTFVPGETRPSWGELRLGASDNPFAVPNLQLETGDAAAHVRIGWLRSVANVYHAFAIQSFAAELAHAAERDQKDYLLELIGPPRIVDPREEGAEYDNYGDPFDEYPIDTARLANVTREAAAMADWGRELPEGHGLGIATHRSFLTYVSTVVEVAVDGDGRVSIEGVWAAMDAGTVVNPGHVRAQLEGGTIYGLSNAMYGAITAKDGAVEQANFPDWRVMRMREAPRAMEVKVIESDAPPGGVGEPPTPPAAPALANAIFAASGVRVRTLPVFGSGGNDRLPLDDADQGATA